MEESIVEELNKFLTGIHMGAATFKDFLEKAENSKLREEIIKIIESFKRHEEAITNRIEELGGDASDKLGFIGTMSDMWQKIKLISVDSDTEVCEKAIKAIDIGLKNGKKFIDEHIDLELSIINDIEGVVADYDNHLRHLNEISVEIIE